MQVEMWSLDRIKPYENNPRLNDDAVDAVIHSIKEFGFRQPIVVDTAGVIIVGHTRFKAATKMGLAEVPVHVAKDMEPEAVRAYRIADNRTGESAQWALGTPMSSVLRWGRSVRLLWASIEGHSAQRTWGKGSKAQQQGHWLHDASAEQPDDHSRRCSGRACGWGR